jgi:hypothetical protein
MSGLYVFALTDQAAAPFRYDDHRIEFIAVAGIYAAVERVSAPPGVSEAALRAQHDIVLKVFASVDAVLPARFGALVDVEELERLVTMRQSPIRETLTLVSGRAQMTVRVFADGPRNDEGGAAAHDGRNPLLGRAGRDSLRVATGTEYLEQRRQPSPPGTTGPAAALAAAVSGLVVSERVHRGHGRVDRVLYHLVDRGVVARYKQVVAPFESDTVAVSGPWPAFAFVPDLWA